MIKILFSLRPVIFVLIMSLASCATFLKPDFIITDTKIGTGAEAAAGSMVVVKYTGWLYDANKSNHKGRRFDLSRPGKPLSFQLGAGRVIQGWEQGIAGMKTGGRRKLIIPSDLAYGERGVGKAIPPDATLVFDIELIEIR